MTTRNETAGGTLDIINARLSDIKYIESLRRQESEALGFIPQQRFEMEITGERGGDIILAIENGDPVGYAYITYGIMSAKIQQIAIQEDARRMERATIMIDEIRSRALLKGIPEMGCRCAEDLQSNSFWKELGFEKTAEGLGKSVYSRGKAKLGKRGRHINIYRVSTGLYAARLI